MDNESPRGRHMAQWTNRAKCVSLGVQWAQETVKGGRTKAQRATQGALALPPYIPMVFA